MQHFEKMGQCYGSFSDALTFFISIAKFEFMKYIFFHYSRVEDFVLAKYIQFFQRRNQNLWAL